MPFKLPPQLGSPKDLLERFGKAKQRREPWETHMRECYEYGAPHRENFHLQTPGNKRHADLFDSTALLAVDIFVARLQSQIVPPWREWSIFAPGSEIPEKDREGVQRELDIVTNVVFDYIHHSNFDTQITEAFTDLSVSTGNLTCEDSGDPERLLQFRAHPLGSVYLEEGPWGDIEGQWRCHEPKARMVSRLWPGAEPSANLQRCIKDKPEDTVKLVEGTIYHAPTREYWTIVIEEDEKHVLHAQNSATSPWASFRERVSPGEIYGRGRLMTVLPDIKTCNKAVEYVLRSAAISVAGIYTARSDGVINPYTMRVQPGVIPVKSNDRANPSIAPLPSASDVRVGELTLQDLRKRINDVMFAQPYGSVEDQPVRSATEMALRQSEMTQQATPTMGRIQSELIEKLLKRIVHILRENGKIPKISVDGKEVTIKHTSPLARAQDQQDLAVFGQWAEMNSAVLGPDLFAMRAKLEEVPGWTAQKMGLDMSLLRNDGEKAALEEKVAQMLATMQMQQQQGRGNGN